MGTHQVGDPHLLVVEQLDLDSWPGKSRGDPG